MRGAGLGVCRVWVATVNESATSTVWLVRSDYLSGRGWESDLPQLPGL